MGLLRTLFAIAVVFAHTSWNGGYVFVGGQNAVRLFYLISGFLISYILNNDPAYKSTPKFYLSRALRIYPIYWVVLLLTLGATLVVGGKFLIVFSSYPVAAKVYLIIANILLFGQDWSLFLAAHGGQIAFSPSFADSQLHHGLLVPQAWTLAVELTFYLIAPFVLRNRKLLTGLLALSLSLRVGFAVLASGFAFSDPWTYRFFPFELSLFLAGALSQQLLLPLWEKHPRKEMLARYSTIAFAIVSVAYFLIPVPEGIKTALLLGAFVVILPLTFIFQNGHRFDKTIGNLSYPIYVGHLLVIDGMSKVAVRLNVHSDLAISLVSVAASLVFAYGLNEMIAEPLEKYRRKVKGRQFGTEQTAEAAIGGGGGRSG